MGQTTSQSLTSSQSTAPPSGCPVHKSGATASAPPAGCPVHHEGLASTSQAQCPVDHQNLNPLNQMPSLSQSAAPQQTMQLPVQRTASTIPRGDQPDSKWEYPSPQQFYNALVRKGWETPEEHVETMVEIHNFLNEKAWEEVLKWESRHDGSSTPQLARFMGKPGILSPKARLYLFAGWLLPSRFNNEPPFDRHDWIIRRPSTGEEVRYVIDYYSAPPESDGSPVFSLDVRPALDSFGSIKDRVAVATEDIWVSLRENERREQLKRSS